MTRLSLLGLMAALLCWSNVGSAAIFTVTMTSIDAPDDDPGDGLCQSTAGTFCTLRAAIVEANALPGTDIVVIPEGVTIDLHIQGLGHSAATGDLDITETIAIGSFTATQDSVPQISATQLDNRIFDVRPGTDVFTLTNVRLLHGDNTVGGAIAVRAGTQANIHGVDFRSNIAEQGGAMYVDHASVLIEDSRFNNNAVSEVGSAIAISCGQVAIRHTSIFGNLNLNPVGGWGEAVFHQGDVDASPPCELIIENSSLLENDKAAINSNGPTTLRLLSTTVAHNRTHGVRMSPDGTNQSLVLEVKSSAFFDNDDLDCMLASVDDLDIAHNIVAPNAGGCNFTPDTNIIAEPKFDGPQDDMTSWHRVSPPRPDSPAIDASFWVCPEDDQRHAVRPFDGDNDGLAQCDIGAFEYDPMTTDLFFFDAFN